jgi:hypothetical protein
MWLAVIVIVLAIVTYNHITKTTTTTPTPTPTPTPEPFSSFIFVAPAAPSNPSTSTTPSIGLYGDSQAESQVTSIEWGNIVPGIPIQRSCYIKNDGKSSFSITNIAVNNLICKDNTGNLLNSDDYREYFNLTLDCIGAVLEPKQIQLVTFTLDISPLISTVTKFNLDITISAS